MRFTRRANGAVRRGVFRRLVMPGVASLLLAATLLPAAGATDPFPSFWPTGAPLLHPGFDQWRVWLARCEARQTPTSVFNLLERRETITVWVNELRRRGLTVNDVMPPQRYRKLEQLMGQPNREPACREVDLILRDLEALVQGKEPIRGSGTIEGRVIDEMGQPVGDASVTLLGSPLGAFTDAEGRFRITNVPCLAPRYVLRARKEGYLDSYAQPLGLQPGRAAEALLVLESTTPERQYRNGVLAVKIACLVEIKQVPAPTVAVDTAVIDMNKYPDTVKPYLKPSRAINSDDENVRAQALHILASVPEADRTRSTAIVRAVFEWLSRNIEYDVTHNFPDDPTCGQWQLTYGAFGRSFDDWCHRPSEVLKEGRAIAAEYERLAAALLRALGIPARPAFVGSRAVCQWWVQLPTGNGYWCNMETSVGREQFKRTAKLDMSLPVVSDDQITLYSVDERAPAPVTWDAARPCLWLQDFGERAVAKHDPGGLTGAQKWLTTFEQKGFLPGGARQEFPPKPNRNMVSYVLESQGVVIDLASLGDQAKLTVIFPLGVSNQYRMVLDAKHWTNRPAWLKPENVRRDMEENAITGEKVQRYVMEFQLGTPPASEPEPEGGG